VLLAFADRAGVVFADVEDIWRREDPAWNRALERERPQLAA
jgi:hypothetical protein